MKQSTKRFASMIIALGLIIGAFVIFFNLVQPAYGTIGRMRGELESRKKFADEQAQIIQSVKTLIGISEGGGPEREQIGLVFPEGPQVANAVGQVNGLMVLNGLAPQGIGIIVEDSVAVNTVAQASESASLSAAPIRKIR